MPSTVSVCGSSVTWPRSIFSLLTVRLRPPSSVVVVASVVRRVQGTYKIGPTIFCASAEPRAISATTPSRTCLRSATRPRTISTGICISSATAADQGNLPEQAALHLRFLQ